MRIITISREFGSGGRELGKRLSDRLGYDYYDREIITAIAMRKGMDERYVEKMLEGEWWHTVPLTYRNSFHSPDQFRRGTQVQLLLEQKQIIESIARLGKDFIIVGRNADVILAQYHPFNLFVCASRAAKCKRCKAAVPNGYNIPR